MKLGGVGVEEVSEEGVAELGFKSADDLGAEVLLVVVEGTEATNETVDGLGVSAAVGAPMREQMKTSKVRGSGSAAVFVPIGRATPGWARRKPAIGGRDG